MSRVKFLCRILQELLVMACGAAVAKDPASSFLKLQLP
jgi:hypothetical protein